MKTNYPLPGGGGSNPNDYEQNTYDPASNLVFDRRRDGVSICPSGCNLYGLVYDALNRKTVDLNGAALSYDNLNHVTSATLNGSTVSMAYDALGRKTSETDGALGTLSYQYDLAGGRTRITWPDGLYINYVRDADEEVTQVEENGATSGVGLLASYSYDTLGRRTGITRGNGATTGYGYDAISRLTYLGQTLNGQSQSWSFTYNAQSQVDTKGSTNSLFDYNGAYAVNRAYTNNGLNQMTTSGPNTLTYTDGRGNLTSDGVNTYGYNELNQLISRSGGVSLTYDALGRLASTYSPGTSTTQFAYSGDQLVTEYDGSGNLLRRYVPGALGADDPILWYEGAGTSNRRWLIDDYQGSVIAATDGTGAIIGGAPNTYDEYGVPGSANQGRYQYTGQIYIPELGLYHYKARTYSPTLGRFLEADPIGYKDNFDLYEYVADDPVDHEDSSGLMSDYDCQHTGGKCAVTQIAPTQQTNGNDVVKAFAPILLPVIQGAAQAVETEAVVAAGTVATVAGATVGGVALALVPSSTASNDTPKLEVYRLWGGTSGPLGQSWTTVDPRTMKNPRDQLGLPNGNTATTLSKGYLVDTAGVQMRDAVELHGNRGGAPELLVPVPGKQIQDIVQEPFREPDK